MPPTDDDEPSQDCESKSSPHSTRSHSAKRHEDKKCGVCGDRALGYNFNAVTCESCKAFFRRNALKNKDFRCPFNDQCEVNSVTRRFCQRCRLRKCFDIGMKKEWIMTEDEKQKKRRKIEINRSRKMETTPTESNGPYSPEIPGNLPLPEAELDSESVSSPQSLTSVSSKRPLSKRTSSNGIVKNRTRANTFKNQRKLRLTARAVTRSPSIESDGDTRIMDENGDSREPTGRDLLIPKQEFDEFHSPQSTSHDIPAQSGDNPFAGEVTARRPLLKNTFQPEYRSEAPPTNLSRFEPVVSQEIPSSTVTYFEDGLVADLLRSDSQSPKGAETFYATSSEDSQRGHYINSPTEHRSKKLKQEIAAESHYNSILDYSNRSGAELPSCPTAPSEVTSTPLPVAAEDSFDFTIQDALQMLRPGCRNREPTTYAQSVMDSIVNTAISAEYNAFNLLSGKTSGELNQAEKMKISELFEANRGLLAPLCEDANFKDSPDPSLINVINLTEIAIRRLIKMSKKISSFKTLCQEDQIALLKAGCTELMILKSVSAYDPDKDSWKIKQDQHSFKSIKLKVLKTAPGNVYEEHKRFILAFKPELRQDLNIMLLLSAIVLFTPERPFILHADAIRHEQSSYLYLLKRYVEIKYGSCEGITVFYKLLERISHLHVLNEDHVRVFLEANPKEMEPLLIEIFDLKQS